jgi:bacillithiol biosynthesis cysteine-adding enzyme BshC
LNLKQLPFKELGFSKLFCDYCVQSQSITPFFDFNPFDTDSLHKRNQFQVNGIQGSLEVALKAYNPIELLHENAKESLRNLIENPNTRTIVTGQQLTLAGGPVFTLFKILTSISESRKLSKKLGHPVVPIFWLADEDQDFDEIASVTLPSGSDLTTISMDEPEVDSQRAGFIPVTDNTVTQIEEILKVLPETDFNPEISTLLKSAYTLGKTHNDAFAHLVLKLFSRFGLLVFGSARSEARALLGDTFHKLILRSNEIHNALESTSQNLESTYHRQVSVSSSNWFICKSDGSRSKLSFENGIWTTSEGQTFSTEELATKAKAEPELLSPNVFMRPLLQDVLLPNLGIVAGPGEVAYYAQTREMYKVCEMQMPVVIPRFSGMLIEPYIEKSLSELPFKISDFSKRHEDLETEFVQKTQDVDLDAFFNEWSNQISALAESKKEVIESVDPTLIGTLKRIESDQNNALNQLKGKIFKAVKTRQEVQIKRIHRVQNNLFPGRVIQERGLGFVYFLNKYGFGLIDDLLEVVDSNQLDVHYVVDL